MERIGNTLNKRYRLDRKIGEGGFAQVFLATDVELGRQVAVKVLGQDWTRNKDVSARFRNEARAIAALDHPNILQIYDFGVAKGSPYLVMPYVSGGTLAALMKQGPFTLDEIGFYLKQIGSALDYAHQHGIVHRDIKPSNLLMRSDGQLLLMDFGLAKLLDNVLLEAATVIMGTIAYMAPEQCVGLVSAASDIYMLGVILYQVLAGKLPYEGNTTQIMEGHVHATPGSLINQPTMRTVPPPVVQALDQVLKKVLAKHPADRYATCQALSSAYYAALKADPAYLKRVVSFPHRNATPDVLHLDRTLVEGKQDVMLPTASSASPEATLVTPPDVPPASRGQTPAPGTLETVRAVPPNIPPVPPPAASPLKGTNPAYPAYQEQTGLAVAQTGLAVAQTGLAVAQTGLAVAQTAPPSSDTSGFRAQTPVSADPEATLIEPHSSKRELKLARKLLKPARLLVTTEPDKGFKATFDLTGEMLTLGRAADNMLCLPLPTVSRYHAVFKRLNNEFQEPLYKIVQLKSINPICFKGQKVSEKVLEHGDTIEIGQRGYAEYIVKLTYQAAEYGFA